MNELRSITNSISDKDRLLLMEIVKQHGKIVAVLTDTTVYLQTDDGIEILDHRVWQKDSGINEEDIRGEG